MPRFPWESSNFQRATCESVERFVTPKTRRPSGNCASASIQETAFVRNIRSPKSGSRSCASHTIRARLKSSDVFNVAIRDRPGRCEFNRRRGGLPRLILQRRLRHQPRGGGQRARLVHDHEFGLQVETVAPAVVERIRILLRAVPRKTQRAEFFFVKIQPAKSALEVADGNAARRENAAIVLRVLMNDLALAFPAEAGEVTDVDGIAAAFVIQIFQNRFECISDADRSSRDDPARRRRPGQTPGPMKNTSRRRDNVSFRLENWFRKRSVATSAVDHPPPPQSRLRTRAEKLIQLLRLHPSRS